MSDQRAGDGSRPAFEADATRAPAAGASRPATTAHGGWRAWAELLRAPLLLSPLADVLAGWTVGMIEVARHSPGPPFSAAFDAWPAARTSLPALGLAALTGVCLLGAGMAQNALADRRDDALRKPDRPLPRGALSPRAVAVAMVALVLIALACATKTGSLSVSLCLGIIALTAAYHGPLKRFRLPACVALGTLRGLDLLLGSAAAAAIAQPWRSPLDETPWPFTDWSLVLRVALLYALFMTGASLHASTDDSPSGPAERGWSRVGLMLHAAALILVSFYPGPASSGGVHGDSAHAATRLLFPAVALWALARLLSGWRRLPPGPLTGVALSGLYLFAAIVCLRHDLAGLGLAAATLVLLLFGASRRMRRAFPPT